MMIFMILLNTIKLIVSHARQCHKFSSVKFILSTLYPRIIFINFIDIYTINNMIKVIIA